MKPGYKTTEFWLTALAMLLGALMASGLLAEGSMPLQVAGMVSVVLAKLGYTSSRTKSKVADSLGKPETPPEE